MAILKAPGPKPKRRKRKSKREPKGTGKGYAPVEFRTDPDFRWAGYTLKSCQKSTRRRRCFMRRYGLEDDRRWVAQFEGKSVTTGHPIPGDDTRLPKCSRANRGSFLDMTLLLVMTRSLEAVSPHSSLLVMGRRQKFALPLAVGDEEIWPDALILYIAGLAQILSWRIEDAALERMSPRSMDFPLAVYAEEQDVLVCAREDRQLTICARLMRPARGSRSLSPSDP